MELWHSVEIEKVFENVNNNLQFELLCDSLNNSNRRINVLKN